jgi:plastocyanin
MARTVRPLAPVLLLAAGLALGSGPGRLVAADAAVVAEFGPTGFVFTPSSVTVNVGDQVTWTGIASGGHTVTRSDLLFDSPTDFSFRFTQAGTYDYFCRNHFGMTGRVVVLAGGESTPRPVPTLVPGQSRLHVPAAPDGAVNLAAG